uniref:Uncharacterized protein n=1 Tax=Cajanus cajan TaxID=3821 RepID=A0A151S403_CAJCA|nr:hypothetical protein KK1_028732 [Cajanus cajan]
MEIYLSQTLVKHLLFLHSPILICVNHQDQRETRDIGFRFMDNWLADPSFEKDVIDA